MVAKKNLLDFGSNVSKIGVSTLGRLYHAGAGRTASGLPRISPGKVS
jgi:hypothetical protein